MNEPTLELLKCSDVILEIIDGQQENDLPRGDLQAIIEGQIRVAYFLGKKQALKEAIKTVENKPNFQNLKQ